MIEASRDDPSGTGAGMENNGVTTTTTGVAASDSLKADSRTQQIKAFALAAGADVVGIADPLAWDEYVPEGHRPADLLPNVRSIIVAGSRGPTGGAWRSPNHRVMEINGYDFRNDAAIHRIADMIEQQHDHQAIQAPGLPTSGHLPQFSMMLAAVLAGLGTRSLAANIILNPQYGLLYYSACLTTLELEFDEMLEEGVCPHHMCVESFRRFGKTPCLAACPSDEGGCLDGSIDDQGRIEYSC